MNLTPTRSRLCFATLNHSPLLVEGIDLAEQLRAAADAGFILVELDVFSIRTYLAAGRTLSDLDRTLTDNGLACYAIAGLNVYDDPVRSDTEAADLARICEQLQPRWLLMRLAGDYDRNMAHLRRYVAQFGGTDSFGFEPSPFTVLRTIGDAERAVDAIGSGAVIVDRGTSSLPAPTGNRWPRLPDERFAYVQTRRRTRAVGQTSNTTP